MTRQNIIAARWGDLYISKGFLGNVTVLHTPVFDDFSRPDGPLCDGVRWIDYGPSTDYTAEIVESGKCRMGIPDGLMDRIERVTYARYGLATVTRSNGYLECRVFTRGDSVTTQTDDQRYQTTVFAKVSNDSFDNGIGLRMAASHLTLVVRTNGIDKAVASFGTYSAGDVLRMRFEGNQYGVLCNGRLRGTWVDSKKIVVDDEGHRSLGIRVHGAHEESGVGPRRFSPALDYVEYG